MTTRSTTERAAEWVYYGVWAVLTSWFRVPADAPVLPATDGEVARAFKPDRAFLRYQKLYFWIVLVLIDLVLTAAWVAILIASRTAGIILFIPYLIVAIIPDILAYVAIHLRYDTTWYVMNSRSLRIRRGIWSIRETTVTFENVQNVDMQQGPVQRYFGIGSLVVHTAGGGGAAHGKQAAPIGAHIAVIEGIGNTREIRDQIMQCAAASRSAGLGDEARPHTHDHRATTMPAWNPAHLETLREIRSLAQAAAGRT